MSTNDRCGDMLGLESSRAFARSPLLLYSRQERTPWRKSILIVGCGFVSAGACPRKSVRNGESFLRCSRLSRNPGAEIEPVTNARPTGSNGFGGSDFEANPAQKAWR